MTPAFDQPIQWLFWTGLHVTPWKLIGYVGTTAPILGVGWLSDHIGLPLAIVSFCVFMAVLTSSLCWLAYRTPVMEAA